MKKLATLAAAAALAVTMIPAVTSHAFAQSLTNSAVVAQDHSMRSSKLIGMAIFNDKGEKIGTISDILVKGSASEPMAVLSVGEYTGGSKMVAVPLSHITMKADKPIMIATKAGLQAMQEWHFVGLAVGGG